MRTAGNQTTAPAQAPDFIRKRIAPKGFALARVKFALQQRSVARSWVGRVTDLPRRGRDAERSVAGTGITLGEEPRDVSATHTPKTTEERK